MMGWKLDQLTRDRHNFFRSGQQQMQKNPITTTKKYWIEAVYLSGE